MTTPTEPRTNAQHHRAAATSLRRAIGSIRQAVRDEDGLELDGRLRDLLRDAEEIEAMLSRYATY